MRHAHWIAYGFISCTLLGAAPAALATVNAANINLPTATPASPNANDHAKNVANLEISKRRQALAREAVLANDDMLHAIFFLEKKDSRQAFKMLEDADGKLGVLLARDPQLKLAAIDVRSHMDDMEASPKLIDKAVREARTALDHGQIQIARARLSTLESEIHIDTDYLPMEIYPATIKQASKEIQQSRLSDAEATLADALGSIVTVEDVIPLPPIKAEGDVLKAEQLLKHGKAKSEALSLLDSADTHLANAKALGYGDYQGIRDEIASIKSRMGAGIAKPDLFARIKNLFHDTRQSITAGMGDSGDIRTR